jgi:alpha-galactosidase
VTATPADDPSGTSPRAPLRLVSTWCELVVDVSAGVPAILYWGAPLGDAVDPATVRAALARPTTSGALDVVAPLSLVPEHGSGHDGRPGLLGHRRRGTSWAPRFALSSVDERGDGVEVRCVDLVAGLELVTEIVLDHTLRIACTIVNRGDDRYLLDALTVCVPMPSHAAELLTLHGRWTREFSVERRPWTTGTWSVENRLGRTSHERPPLVFAGELGFGEWSGEVWGLHLAWSGNHTILADHLPDGRRCVQLGELLHPGEVSLAPGASYRTPWVIGTHSEAGLTAATQRYHRHARSLPAHPARPRPVLLNTWEATYFDHDLDRLRRFATVAAELGVERFVLDNGWFGGRRHDRAGLGDWWVSPQVYPDGLAPLIDHVTSLGMEFGIWVEPEMVNPDSDLYREHPDWALTTPGYDPVLGRNQLVVDLARPEARDHVLGQLDRLLADHDISFVKWDMNRAHVQGSGAGGAAGSHAQTLAVAHLLDELRARHPRVEFESCSSGGGRIDLDVLRRAERVWTSDCNDPLERQFIQRGASLLVPPEVMGCHIGPTRAHTTGRSHSLAFRALTAFFGHLGIEWNVLELSDDERTVLAAVIAEHRRFRHLLHTGDVVRFDPVLHDVGASGLAHGVYAPDRSQALVSYAQVRTGMSLVPPVLRLPGLDPDRPYRISEVQLGQRRPPVTLPALTGRQLAAHGVQLPVLAPESGVLVHLVADDPPA